MSRNSRRTLRLRGVIALAVVAAFATAGCASSKSDSGSADSQAPQASSSSSEISVDGTPSPSDAGADAATEPSQPVERGALTVGALLAPPSLNPGIGDPAYGMLYQWAYDPLVVTNPDGSVGPGLAVKWGYVDDANREYELTLREGVTFSDGAELDADAVKTYLDYERAQPTSTAQLLANVESIEVAGPLTLAIHLSASDPGLTYAFAQGFGGGNIASPTAIAEPESLDFATAGAGPYMLDPGDSVVNDHYTFVPNPHYWNPERVHWDKVVVRVIPNSSSMIEAMRAGQIQFAQGDPTTVSAAQGAGLQVIGAPQALTGLNLMDRNGELSEPLADVRVRQALNHAVDRAAIAEALYGDPALALSQYALQGHLAFDPALDDANAYDIDLARQLLTDAGYPDGFTLEVVDTNVAGLHTLVEAIAGQVSEIGVTLDITTPPEVNDYFGAMVGGEYPAAVVAYGLANMQTLYVGYVNAQGPFNPFHVVDDELDALYAEYFATVGDSADVQQRINARLVEQGWAVPVVGAPLVYYLAQGLTGIEATTGNSGVPTIVDVNRG